MALTQFNGGDLSFQLLQDSWAAKLEPLLKNPVNNVTILKNVSLLAASNPNVVNHLLGRKLQGWFIVRQRAAASVYDAQDTNQSPTLTLNLRTSADVTVDIAVF